MWPFKKKRAVQIPAADPREIQFSQVDTTERFGDNLTLKPDDWIETIPLNSMVPDGEKMGLPAVNASADEVYQIADRMSQLRESFPIPNDGVYCPLCHIANISLARLRTPCPQCGRPLLKFGWD